MKPILIYSLAFALLHGTLSAHISQPAAQTRRYVSVSFLAPNLLFSLMLLLSPTAELRLT